MLSRPIEFQVTGVCQNSHARVGVLHSKRGVVETPVFMPVGTLGSVKSLDPRDLQSMGAGITLANAYHLMLRPGDQLVAQLGGLHRFSGYDGMILTDSGGFQVFSLSGLRKISDEGVSFRSHIDGSLFHLTPERLVEVQENLGPDIAMVLDECPPAKACRSDVLRAVERTSGWARRAIAARTRQDIAWFGIVQGALFEDIRARHVQELVEMPFDGYAIGGVSVGEEPEEIDNIVNFTAPLLPANRPRYLMGVGTPSDLVRGVAAGVDMFDCVMPTRNARNGYLFTSHGRVVIKHSVHRTSEQTLDAECSCYTCRTYSRAYLRHLYMCREITYTRLATLHNLAFYMRLMETMRRQIREGLFDPAQLLCSLEHQET